MRASAILLALLVAGCAAPPAATVVAPAPPPSQAAPAAVRPVAVAIPAIGLDASDLVPLTLAASGELSAPADYDRVGWFTGGPVPGDPGPAVLAGHVDSRTGPAVFFRLRELGVGERVTVRRSDGRTVEYTVDSVRRYPKDDFPTATVYGAVPGVALRLITCGGSFDQARKSYRDNVVVYASVHEW